MEDTGLQAKCGRGQHGIRFAILTVVLALVVGVVTSASSTGGSASLSSKCKTARQKFSAWTSSSHSADDAFSRAFDQWVSVDPNLQPGDALTAAINQYNASLQSAQQLEAKAAKDLASTNKAIKACKQSSMPKACKGEFATYKPIIDHRASSSALDTMKVQAIAEMQQAQLANDAGTFNAAVGRYNGVNAQHNQLVDTFNNSLLPAYNDARRKCTKAA